jgi:hypothetical protein
MATAAKTTSDSTTRILDMGRQAGTAYLDAYEKAALSFAELQERAARQSQVEWLSSVMEAQARSTRELATFWASAGRDLIK